MKSVISFLFFIVTTLLPLVSITVGFAALCSMLYVLSAISMLQAILLVVAFVVILCNSIVGVYYHAIERHLKTLDAGGV